MYMVMFALHPRNLNNLNWLSFAKFVLNDVELTFTCDDQKPVDRNVLRTLFERQLKDQFIQSWFSNANNSSRGEFYFEFKKEFRIMFVKT